MLKNGVYLPLFKVGYRLFSASLRPVVSRRRADCQWRIQKRCKGGSIDKSIKE
jgi:hypothetical protein